MLPLIEKYLDSVDDCDVDTRCTVSQYLKLISYRASGAWYSCSAPTMLFQVLLFCLLQCFLIQVIHPPLGDLHLNMPV